MFIAEFSFSFSPGFSLGLEVARFEQTLSRVSDQENR